MKRGYYLIVLLMLTAAWGCSGGSSDKAAGGSGPEAVQPVEIKDIHDSLVMKVPEVLEYCRKHELWADYYDTWMLLGQEYNFSGETNMAIKVAKEIHDDATKRDNHYECRRDTTIAPIQFDNWLYYYHHSCYYYYMMKKDWDRAEMHVDSVVKHIEAVGWSKITRNEVLAYRTQLAIERKQYAEALKLSNQQMPEGKELDMNAYAGILKQRDKIQQERETMQHERQRMYQRRWRLRWSNTATALSPTTT